jgi:hypothetical protein
MLGRLREKIAAARRESFLYKPRYLAKVGGFRFRVSDLGFGVEG